MNAGTIVGALLGGAAGYFFGGKALLPAGAGLVVGAVAGTAVNAAASPALPGGTNGSLILQSGVPSMSVGLTVGLPFTVQLPPGASWTANQNPMPATPTSPITWTYQGPGTIVLDWTDSTSQPQETTITFFNAS
jgi:hypothetical protein